MPDTDFFKIIVEYGDPDIAFESTKMIADRFVVLSNDIYESRFKLLKQQLTDINNFMIPLRTGDNQYSYPPYVNDNNVVANKQFLNVKTAESLPTFPLLFIRKQELETSIARSRTAKIIDPPFRPSSFSSPDVKLNIIISLVLGLVLGIFIALLREYLDKPVEKHGNG